MSSFAARLLETIENLGKSGTNSKYGYTGTCLDRMIQAFFVRCSRYRWALRMSTENVHRAFKPDDSLIMPRSGSYDQWTVPTVLDQCGRKIRLKTSKIRPIANKVLKSRLQNWKFYIEYDILRTEQTEITIKVSYTSENGSGKQIADHSQSEEEELAL